MEQSIPHIRQESMWELQFERQITLRNHGESLLVRSNVSAELWICPMQHRDRDGWSWYWLESVCWIVGECLLDCWRVSASLKVVCWQCWQCYHPHEATAHFQTIVTDAFIGLELMSW